MTGINDLSGYWQYFAAHDFVGLITALYQSVMGVYFFGVMIFILSVPLYMRTSSLTYCAVLWIILSGLLLTLDLPAIALKAIQLFVFFAVTGTLFYVFDRLRR